MTPAPITAIADDLRGSEPMPELFKSVAVNGRDFRSRLVKMPELAELSHQCLMSSSFARTSSGPNTRTFMASRIETARSTKLLLVAKTPRSR